MPTKKRRVGFIPRSDVLDLINKLSNESNLSNSKIINILVEEALYKRGLFNIKNGKMSFDESEICFEMKKKENTINAARDFTYEFRNNFLTEEDLNKNEEREDSLDNEIYAKFIMFLQFQERMKKNI